MGPLVTNTPEGYSEPTDITDGSQLKNLVLPMPSDSEINWREHRPGIKGRNIFRMILDSSSKLHTVSMRLLFITLTCLAASCLALPQPKQKRDILPGDPRYGTDHHHHHDENVIQDAKSYKEPQDTYGPPGHQPGTPLKNSYLSPVESDSVQQQITSYGIPETVSTGEVQKTVTSTVSLPVQNVETVEPPATSYGVPLVKSVKTTSETNSRVKSTIKTVQTEVHEHQQAVPQTAKVAPAVQEVTHYTGVNSVPVTTTLTKNVDSNVFAETLPNFYNSYNVPNYDVTSYLPSSYSTIQQPGLNAELHSGFSSYNNVPAVYSGFGSNYPLTSAYRGVNLPLSYQFANTLPTYAFPRLIQISKNTPQFPYTLTGTQPFASVQQSQTLPIQQVHVESVKSVEAPVQPTVHSVQTPVLYSVPSVTQTKTVTPVQHTLHSVQSVEAPVQHSVHSVQSVEAPVQHSVHSVQPLVSQTETVTPVQHTVHSVQSVEAPVQHSVHSVQPLVSQKTVTPVQHTVHSVQSVEAPVQQHSVHSVQPVVTHTKTVIPFQHTVHSIHSIEPVQHTVETVSHPVETVSHPVESVKTVHQPVKSVDILQPPAQSEQTYHTLTEVKSKTVPVGQSQSFDQNQKGFFEDIISQLPQFPSLPSLPSLPSFDFFPSSTPSQEDPIDDVSSSYTAGHVQGIAVSSTPASLVKNEYVQPTDANGGYIY